ncbi:MAG: HNH endonuclease [Telluria sp.]
MYSTPIEEARDFVRKHVQDPALNSDLPAKIKAKVKNSNIWLERFQRVGDLLHYLRRFRHEDADPTYLELKARGLQTFEDILPEFERRFGAWGHDRTRSSDFVVGEKYTSHEILIFSDKYDTRSGGIHIRKNGVHPTAAVIKATLNDGRYPNQWIDTGCKLKYYMQEINGKFKKTYETNFSILNNPRLPILTFVRAKKDEAFVFQGFFRYAGDDADPDGSLYFVLEKSEQQPLDTITRIETLDAELNHQVAQSLDLSTKERQERLARATKRPRAIEIVTRGFIRNPDVIAEVLLRAKGFCEKCGDAAPFKRRSDGSGYLEVHHKIPLAMGGDDTVQNAVAVCPNCHREAHYG